MLIKIMSEWVNPVVSRYHDALMYVASIVVSQGRHHEYFYL